MTPAEKRLLDLALTGARSGEFEDAQRAVALERATPELKEQYCTKLFAMFEAQRAFYKQANGTHRAVTEAWYQEVEDAFHRRHKIGRYAEEQPKE